MTLYIVDINKDIFVQLTTATHGTPIYATVLVENCAGLQSTFSSKKLILDHTPPEVDGIDVKQEVERLIDDENDNEDVARNIYSDSNANVTDNNTILDIFNRSETLTTLKETEPVSTPPSVSDADDRRRVKLKISWQARDQESGIELCMVSVGMSNIF